MPYDIVIGREESERQKFGDRGTIFIGKHYVKMGQTTSLSNPIYLDVAKSHVIFICGKRGSGKSYTMGVIAEAISDLPAEVSKNISVIMLDTMGIYWTMKYPNQKESKLLDEWGMKPKSLKINIFTPSGYFQDFKNKGIPTDRAFSIKPSELSAVDWCTTFDISPDEAVGVAISRIVSELQEGEADYDIDEIIKKIQGDEHTPQTTKDAAENRFRDAKTWGLFDRKGTPLKDLVQAGQVSILDVSCYLTSSSGKNIRALVIGLVSKKLFIERMLARREEEYNSVNKSVSFMEDEEGKKRFPIVWLVVDEAHEFLPKEGKTLASEPLITILREGRQPGISLILASQQPGKIHTDVMTQSDIVISHRITAKIDIDALGMLMQSYMRMGLDKVLNNLPRVSGAAIVFDDTNERMYPMRIRPRFSWHGGSSPTAVEVKEKTFEF
jgi:ABC-type dipeptide/oligopeptide/nickel transport system ATPase component